MKFYFILGAASLNINSLKASKADRTPKHACMHISMPKYVHKKFFKIFLFCGIYKICVYLMLQLEKIIGKLKTGKYGSRILEVISKCGNSVQQHDNNAVSKEEQGRGARASKRTKKEKVVVVVDSSDDSEV